MSPKQPRLKVRLMILATGCLLNLLRSDGLSAEENPRILTWEEAEKNLLDNNLLIRGAKDTVDAARARYQGSFSGILPNISATAGYDRFNPLGAGTGVQRQYAYGLNGSLPLFAGGAKRAEILKTSAELEKTQAEYQKAESEGLFTLRQNFSQLLYSQDAIAVADEVVKRRQENVQIIKLKFQAGRESRAALLETQALLDMVLWERERTRKELLLAQRKLNQALGRKLTIPVQTGAFQGIPEPPADFSALQGELDRHPSIVSQESQLRASRESLAQAKSGFFPAASLDGKYNKLDSNWPPRDNTWDIGVHLSWPIFSGGKTRADTTAAKAEMSRARVDSNRIHDEVLIAAEDEFLSWREARSLVTVRQSTLTALQARAWLIRTQYTSGQSTFFEWRDVEERLTEAQKQLLSANRDLFIAYADFERAMGRGVRR